VKARYKCSPFFQQRVSTSFLFTYMLYTSGP